MGLSSLTVEALGLDGIPYRIDVNGGGTVVDADEQFALFDRGTPRDRGLDPIWPSDLRLFMRGVDLSPLNDSTDRSVPVEAYDTAGGSDVLAYRGFMLTDFRGDAPFLPDDRVELRAVDGLGTLQNDDIDAYYGSGDAPPLTEVISKILGTLHGSTLDVEFGVHWYPNAPDGSFSSSDCPLRYVEVPDMNTYRTERPTGDWRTQLYVLQDLLRTNGLTVRQVRRSSGAAWLVCQRDAYDVDVSTEKADLKVWTFDTTGSLLAGQPVTRDLYERIFDGGPVIERAHERNFEERVQTVRVVHDHLPITNVFANASFDEGREVVDVDTTNGVFIVEGDATQDLNATDDSFAIVNSTANDDQYSVSSLNYLSGSNRTEIGVAGSIPDSTADGKALMLRSYSRAEPSYTDGEGDTINTSVVASSHASSTGRSKTQTNPGVAQISTGENTGIDESPFPPDDTIADNPKIQQSGAESISEAPSVASLAFRFDYSGFSTSTDEPPGVLVRLQVGNNYLEERITNVEGSVDASGDDPGVVPLIGPLQGDEDVLRIPEGARLPVGGGQAFIELTQPAFGGDQRLVGKVTDALSDGQVIEFYEWTSADTTLVSAKGDTGTASDLPNATSQESNMVTQKIQVPLIRPDGTKVSGDVSIEIAMGEGHSGADYLFIDEMRLSMRARDQELSQTVVEAFTSTGGRTDEQKVELASGPTKENLAALDATSPGGESFEPNEWGIGAGNGSALLLQELKARQRLRYWLSPVKTFRMTPIIRDGGPVLSGDEIVELDGEAYAVHAAKVYAADGKVRLHLKRWADQGTSGITIATLLEEGSVSAGATGTAARDSTTSVSGVSSVQGRTGAVQLQPEDVDGTLAVDTGVDPHQVGVADSGIDTQQLAQDAVTQDTIAGGAVGTPEIAQDAVTNAKIGADAVQPAQVDETGDYTLGGLTVTGPATIKDDVTVQGNTFSDRFESETYTPGWSSGEGFTARTTGPNGRPDFIEAGHISIRGTARFREFEVRQLTFEKGPLGVTPGGGKLETVSSSNHTISTTGIYDAADMVAQEWTFENDNGDSTKHGLVAGDRLLAQRFDADSQTVVGQIRAIVESVVDAYTVHVNVEDTTYGTPSTGSDKEGWEFIVPASSDAGRDSMLYLDPYVPAMDIFDGLSDFGDWNNRSARTRVGDISNLSGAYASGHGIYTEQFRGTDDIIVGDLSETNGYLSWDGSTLTVDASSFNLSANNITITSEGPITGSARISLAGSTTYDPLIIDAERSSYATLNQTFEQVEASFSGTNGREHHIQKRESMGANHDGSKPIRVSGTWSASGTGDEGTYLGALIKPTLRFYAVTTDQDGNDSPGKELAEQSLETVYTDLDQNGKWSLTEKSFDVLCSSLGTDEVYVEVWLNIFDRDGQNVDTSEVDSITYQQYNSQTVINKSGVFVKQAPGFVSTVGPSSGGSGGGGGAGGGVTSVFGRTGEIQANDGDYTHSQIAGISSDDHHTRPTAGDGLTDSSDTFAVDSTVARTDRVETFTDDIKLEDGGTVKGRITGGSGGYLEVLDADGTSAGSELRVETLNVVNLNVENLENENTSELKVGDKWITVNDGTTSDKDGGLQAYRPSAGSDAYMMWDEGTDQWGRKIGGAGGFDPFVVEDGTAWGIDITGDADTLDGYEAKDFPPKAENVTITGNWTINANGQQLSFDHDGGRILWQVQYNGSKTWSFEGTSNLDFRVANRNTGTSDNFLYFHHDDYLGVLNSSPSYVVDVGGDVNLTGVLRNNGSTVYPRTDQQETVAKRWTYDEGITIGSSASGSETDLLFDENANISGRSQSSTNHSLYFLLDGSSAAEEFRFGFGDTVRSGNESYTATITPTGVGVGTVTSPDEEIHIGSVLPRIKFTEDDTTTDHEISAQNGLLSITKIGSGGAEIQLDGGDVVLGQSGGQVTFPDAATGLKGAKYLELDNIKRSDATARNGYLYYDQSAVTTADYPAFSGSNVTGGSQSALGVYDADNSVWTGLISTENARYWDATIRSVETGAHVDKQTEWGVTHGGKADFRRIYTDELVAKTFTTDLTQALAGSDFLTKSVATLEDSFTVPSSASSDGTVDGGTVTITVQDLPGAKGQRPFADGDWLRARVVDNSGGGLVIVNAWFKINGAINDNGDGTHDYTIQRADTGSTATGRTVQADAPILDYGQSGQGLIRRTVEGAEAPYSAIEEWTSDPVNGGNYTTRVLIGNLRSAYDYTSDVFGFGAGDPFAEHVTVSGPDGIRLRDDTTTRAQLSGSTLSLGATGSEHVQVSSSAVQIRDGNGNVGAELSGSTLSVGSSFEYDASASTLTVSAWTVNPDYLDYNSGDVRIGSSLSSIQGVRLGDFSNDFMDRGLYVEDSDGDRAHIGITLGTVSARWRGNGGTDRVSIGDGPDRSSFGFDVKAGGTEALYTSPNDIRLANQKLTVDTSTGHVQLSEDVELTWAGIEPTLGFEAGLSGVVKPEGWEHSGTAGGYYNVRMPGTSYQRGGSEFGSRYAYGSDSFDNDNGTLIGDWSVSKEWKVTGGGSLTVSLYAWALNYGIPDGTTFSSSETWGGEDDVWIRTQYFDDQGNQISVSTTDEYSKSLSHQQYDSEGSTNDQTWYEMTHTSSVPSNAVRVRVTLQTTDNNDQKIQRGGPTGGNAAVLLDDVHLSGSANPRLPGDAIGTKLDGRSIKTNTLTATEADLTDIFAQSIQVNSGGQIESESTNGNGDPYFQVHANGDFHFGDMSSQYVQWDTSTGTLDITGDAIIDGTISANELSSNSVTADKISIDDSIALGSGGAFFAGSGQEKFAFGDFTLAKNTKGETTPDTGEYEENGLGGSSSATTSYSRTDIDMGGNDSNSDPWVAYGEAQWKIDVPNSNDEASVELRVIARDGNGNELDRTTESKSLASAIVDSGSFKASLTLPNGTKEVEYVFYAKVYDDATSDGTVKAQVGNPGDGSLFNVDPVTEISSSEDFFGTQGATWRDAGQVQIELAGRGNNKASQKGVGWFRNGTESGSDLRHKTDVARVDDPLDIMRDIWGITFEKDGLRQGGIGAQHLIGVYPEALRGSWDTGFAVDYDSLWAPAIESLTVLDDRTLDHERRIAVLEEENEQLRRELKQITT